MKIPIGYQNETGFHFGEPRLSVRLAGKVIETTQEKFDAARFECCLHGGMMKPLCADRLRLDKFGNVTCANCGQHPHETATSRIKKMLE